MSDPIKRDLRAYRIASTIAVLTIVTATVLGGIALKADKKQTRIMQGNCYVAYDGDMVCIQHSKVAQ
jgi:hypothetical protein